MIFVTKCPCDECVPLIKGAGIKQIYAGDVDVGKKKADISYMKFGELEGVRKFTVSTCTFPNVYFLFAKPAGHCEVVTSLLGL
jgi:deoxycytidylate deaminase